MTLPPFLTLAWWAAKLAFGRKASTGSAAAPSGSWLSPWVLVPLALVVTAAVVKQSADRAFERGDAAGYARKAAEVQASTDAVNARIAAAAAETAAANALRSSERDMLVASVKRVAIEMNAARDVARLKEKEAEILKGQLVLARRAKVRIIEKPIVRRVVKIVEPTCAVGDTMTATLNAIR